MDCTEFISKTFLFKGTDEILLREIIEKYPPSIVSYKRGEKIYGSDNEISRVGFVLNGRCEVRRISSAEKCVVLNLLEQFDSFGILSVLSADEFPTHVFAIKNTQILYFTKAEFEEIVKNYSQISKNVIDFLVNRIHFINQKIATFSGTRVENRLAAFILFEAKNRGSDSFEFNCLKTSEEINSGRASVYRALDSFEKNGLIKFDDNKLYIINRKGLERILK